MKKILIVTQNPERFMNFTNGLLSDNTNAISWADSIDSARNAASAPIDLIVIDERVECRSNMHIAMDMIRVNAMAHLALVSNLSPEKFHDAAEGLGALGSIPPYPDEADAKNLLNALAALS